MKENFDLYKWNAVKKSKILQGKSRTFQSVYNIISLYVVISITKATSHILNL